jgi:TolB-like protein/DNA-binding winged helix-turn-helix (wHTH) protein/Tfp pilus assembly protein PilF
MAVSAQPRTVSFGEFTIDVRLKELRRNGIRLKLPGQPFAVLCMLLERPGEEVTREELRAHLLQEETFVDFDHSLNVAINRLREVLCDSAENPRYIETIPRVGYRFIAPVSTSPVSVPANAVPTPGADTHSMETAQQAERALLEIESLQQPTTDGASAEESPSQRKTRYTAAALALLLVCSVAVYFAIRARWQGAAARQGKVMLAVLPFENLTGDPANEYFSDGLTEEIITQLAELQPSRLGVIARTSVMSYKHSDRTIDRVGSQLGVQYILEGSLRQSSGRVRITAQLIQVKDQTHLWAQDYDRDLGDVLTLEREVSGDVAREIQLELTSQRQAILTRPRPVNPEAHELYLKGRFYWDKRTTDGFQKAVDYFQAAIQIDPNYAEAYAGLADAYRFLMSAYPPAEVMPKARAAAEKALAIDPNLAEAHASLGLIAPYYDWDWEGAKKHLQRAIELNPNYATAHHWYGDGYLRPMGKLDESLAELRLAQRLDPLSIIILTDIGTNLFFARRYDEAIVQLRSVLDLDPNFLIANSYLRMAYIEKGMYPEALQMVEKEKALAGEVAYLVGMLSVQAPMGHTEQAKKILAQLLSLSKKEHLDPGMIATCYLALADKDQAMAWLEKAYTERSNYMTTLKVWAAFDPLRGDPRFVDLERRVKLAP